MASRNGLNPKIRGPKGVGFGRALPAPFGFGNGIYPNGTGFINIPALERGTAFPNEFTIEFWINNTGTYTGNYFDVHDTVNGHFIWSDTFNNSVQGNASTGIGYIYTGGGSVPISSKVHIIFTHKTDSLPNPGHTQIFLNSGLSTVGDSLMSTNFNIDRFLIFARVSSFVSQGGYFFSPTDEIRIYKKVLSNQEIVLNYNSGLGSNPSNTEYLLAWYKFEKFDMLDFSLLQDGSDIRLGIKDMSGNNNHAQPNSLDTDPTSSTYVLHAF